MHLGHRGIIKMQKRPFENVQEMNQILIQNYNAVVNKKDTVYILGDISHHLPIDEANQLIGKLNGKKVLMHYPMLSWPKKNSGSIQLHGHIHAQEEYNLQNREEGIRRYDVGVDANYYLPVSVRQIVEFFGG